jgi:hypothetical protein
MGELIPVIAKQMDFGIPMLAIWTKHQQRIAELQLQATAERAAQYATSNKELEERVRVLERIVTDGGYDVATQIEALRDQHRVESQVQDQRETSRN